MQQISGVVESVITKSSSFHWIQQLYFTSSLDVHCMADLRERSIYLRKILAGTMGI